jgi:HPt (histidine-containing phosphotransfer) domain-containing protein
MADPPVDKQAIRDLVDNDSAFLTRLIETFLDDCKTYLAALRTAVEEEDAATLQKEAHGLKGAVANLKAEPAREAARRLEEIGRSGAMEDADRALDRLETEIERLRSVLAEMTEK